MKTKLKKRKNKNIVIFLKTRMENKKKVKVYSVKKEKVINVKVLKNANKN